jgi:hypothetical protein
MQKIAILPTGDWASIDHLTCVKVVELTDAQYFEICDNHHPDFTILSLLEAEDSAEIDKILEIEND